MVKSRKRMAISATVIIAGIILIALALIFYHQGGTHTGVGESSIWYGLENMILGLVGAFLLGSGVILAIAGDYRQPSPYTSGMIEHTEGLTKRSMEAGTGAISEEVEGQGEGMHVEGLVIRLLDGDERRMFMAIKESGGEALQKDLIEKTKMSNAKVTRVLDKLEERGLIVKERHGMTNKVRIDIEQ